MNTSLFTNCIYTIFTAFFLHINSLHVSIYYKLQCIHVQSGSSLFNIGTMKMNKDLKDNCCRAYKQCPKFKYTIPRIPLKTRETGVFKEISHTFSASCNVFFKLPTMQHFHVTHAPRQSQTCHYADFLIVQLHTNNACVQFIC